MELSDLFRSGAPNLQCSCLLDFSSSVLGCPAGTLPGYSSNFSFVRSLWYLGIRLTAASRCFMSFTKRRMWCDCGCQNFSPSACCLVKGRQSTAPFAHCGMISHCASLIDENRSAISGVLLTSLTSASIVCLTYPETRIIVALPYWL